VDASGEPFVALIVMAGSGERLGAGVPKAFVPLGGRALWRHAADTMTSIGSCRELVLVAPAERVDEVRSASPRATVVAGGARRQDSVRLGLAAVRSDAALVAIHDAARPFVAAQHVRATVAEAARTGAAVLVGPIRDTIKRVSGGFVVETLDRSTLRQAQTPQCFRLELVREAHEEAQRRGWDATDDCALLERLGHAVAVVLGDAWNFKITETGDLAAAEALLARRSGGGKETP
jgi:2-C-methyl-D-erythritol 4-phosphate cytidylyltransferase